MKNAGFCGKWSLRNAEVLFMDSYAKETGNYYGAVSLDKNPMVNNPIVSSLAVYLKLCCTNRDKRLLRVVALPFPPPCILQPFCLSALLCVQGSAER